MLFGYFSLHPVLLEYETHNYYKMISKSNLARSHLPHTFQGVYEYIIPYQIEDSLGHIMSPPPKIILTIAPKIVSVFRAHRPISLKHMLPFWCPFLDTHLTIYPNYCYIGFRHIYLRANSHTSQGPWPCDSEGPWLSSKDHTNYLADMLCQKLLQAYLLKMDPNAISNRPWKIIHTLSCRNPCTLFIHDHFFGPLGLHLLNMKWTWTFSAFLSNGHGPSGSRKWGLLKMTSVEMRKLGGSTNHWLPRGRHKREEVQISRGRREACLIICPCTEDICGSF